MLGRPRTGRRSIFSPIKYMLREQRLLFVLIGFAIPALVFNVVHVSTSLAIDHGVSAAHSLPSTALSHVPRRITYELRDPLLMNLGTFSILHFQFNVLSVFMIKMMIKCLKYHIFNMRICSSCDRHFENASPFKLCQIVVF